jgi:hypothetical protein
MIRAALFATALLAFTASAASAAEIQIKDEKSGPESMGVGLDGTLYVGSANTPYVYKVAKGATTAEVFVDASKEGAGAYFWGVFADPATNTVWTCQHTPVAGATPPRRSTNARAFDMKSGAEKLRWTLPGDNTACNDFAVGPDKSIYITDTTVGAIYRLAPGAKAPDLWSASRVLSGVDGITFSNGQMYVNNVVFNKLYRIPIGPDGKAGAPVDIWMDAPIRSPDGLRSANGKLFQAEGSGFVHMLTIDGDTAHVTLVKNGLKQPTGVEPAGDVLWFTERGAGKVWSVPMPK